MALDLKKVALNIGEESVKQIIKEIVLPLLEQEILKSENKYDDLLLPFKAQLESLLLIAADKIDGELN